MNSSKGGKLESALLQIYQDHHLSSLGLREQAENAKRDAMMKAGRVSELLINATNNGVEEAFVNEKIIESEIRSLAVTVSRFVVQTNNWLAISHSLNTAVKEIGDFENWMRTMEFDSKRITSAIAKICHE